MWNDWSCFQMDDGFLMWLSVPFNSQRSGHFLWSWRGITWDSTWESEYREVHQKAAVLYRKQARSNSITTGETAARRTCCLEDQHLKD